MSPETKSLELLAPLLRCKK